MDCLLGADKHCAVIDFNALQLDRHGGAEIPLSADIGIDSVMWSLTKQLKYLLHVDL